VNLGDGPSIAGSGDPDVCAHPETLRGSVHNDDRQGSVHGDGERRSEAHLCRVLFLLRRTHQSIPGHGIIGGEVSVVMTWLRKIDGKTYL
jgi:hypothetical protein